MNEATPPQVPAGDHASGCRADPVRTDCPVDCLAAFISAKAFVPLRRAFGLTSQPPRTVGEVATLLEQGQLSQIRGLGPRRIGEIHTCLALAGLLTGGPDGHRHNL